MKAGHFRTSFLGLAASLAVISGIGMAQAAEPANTMIIELKSGKVEIELLPKLAPQHVARVKRLIRDGFYNDVVFHRVMSGFMAQTGDRTGTGSGGSELPDLPAEFSSYVYKRGTLGAARSNSPNSANSQFFICFNDEGCRGLTKQYTVFGQVISGMEHVDRIKAGAPGSGTVTDPDRMLKVYMANEKK